MIASEPAAKLAPNGASWIVVNASEFLFFGSMETTAQLFQTVILVLEWYFAVFVLAMVYDVFRVYGGLGIGLAALIRSDEGASAVVNLVVLPMAFLSGSFGSTKDYPQVLQAVADVLPLTYLIRLTQAAYFHGTSLFHDLGAVAVVAAWVGGFDRIGARRRGGSVGVWMLG